MSTDSVGTETRSSSPPGWLGESVLYDAGARTPFDDVRQELGRLADQGVTGVWLGPVETTVERPGRFRLPPYVVHDPAVDPVRGGALSLDALVATARRCSVRLLVDAPRDAGVDERIPERYVTDIGVDGFVARTFDPGEGSWTSFRRAVRRARADAVLVTDLDATPESAFDAVIDASSAAWVEAILRGRERAQDAIPRVVDGAHARIHPERLLARARTAACAAERALLMLIPGIPLLRSGPPDAVLEQQTRVLADLRREQPVLRTSPLVPVSNTRPQWVATFAREREGERWFLAINFGHRAEPLEATDESWRGRTVLDVLRSRQVSLGRRQPVLLPPYAFLAGRVM